MPFGGLVKQYQIEVGPLALEKYRLSTSQVAQAVEASNQNADGALLDNQQQAMVVRGAGLIQSIADIESTVVVANDGVPVFVRDVGRVQIGAALQTGIFGVNDQCRSGHLLSVVCNNPGGCDRANYLFHCRQSDRFPLLGHPVGRRA